MQRGTTRTSSTDGGNDPVSPEREPDALTVQIRSVRETSMCTVLWSALRDLAVYLLLDITVLKRTQTEILTTKS